MIRWFAGHPTAANLLMILFLAAGLLTIPSLKRETFPDFTTERVETRVVYLGASAEDVELAICQRLEDAIDGVSYLKELTCEAREGIGIAVAEMEGGADIEQFLNDVKTEVDAITAFPDTTEDPVVRRLDRTDRVISIAITGPMAVPDLKVYAEEIKDKLTALPRVSQVNIDGFSDRQIQIRLRLDELRQHGLSVASVADAISRQSVDLPAGVIETRERDVLVRFTEERRQPLDFASLIVLAGDRPGGEVRLGEIAEIIDTFEVDETKITFNGNRAAILRVTKTKAEDTLIVVDEVRRFLDRARQAAPPGVNFILTEDVSSIVQDRLELLLNNGLMGLALVFGVMWLFFTFRFSFWVAMGLPVSFMGTLFVMAAVGLSINMITMVGLLIAIGLLMDDAIVISESIASSMRQGGSALHAAVEGARKVAPGVFASFATTICVFGPLAFLEGNIGKVLQVMPIVLISVLVVSLIEAFLILPNHLSHALAHGEGKPPKGFRLKFDQGFDWFRQRMVGPAVERAIAWRYLTLGFAVFLLLASLSMMAGGHLKMRAFPDLDGDVIQARVLLAPGTPLARTEAVAERVTAALDRTGAAFADRQPEGQDLIQNTMVLFGYNPDAFESGAHLVTVSADLLTAERRDASIDEVTARWREELGLVPDAVAVTFKEPVIGPAGLAIEIQLQGPDLDRLKQAALGLRTYLAGFRGVVDLDDDLRPGKPELRLTLREGAAEIGLTSEDVARQLRAGFQGTQAGEVQQGSESFEIDVRLAPEDQDSLADLDYFLLIAPNGAEVPLSTVARIEEGRGYSRINRIDGVRTVTVRGDVHGANANEILAQVEREFFNEIMPRDYPGVRVAVSGAQEEQRDTQASMMRAFGFGLLGIFLLLSFQFRSYREPVVVMLSIPLALIGVIWGHIAMGLELSMPSIMGFVSLSGIVVNNAILLVEFTKMNARDGLSVEAALAQASRQRVRAMVLTTATTVAGMTPLLLEKSLQAQVLIPLVTSLAFGLAMATVLVIFVVPAFYAILNDIGWATAGRTAEPAADDTGPRISGQGATAV